MPRVAKKSLKRKSLDDQSLCRCGCGGMVRPGKKFLQGHDSRFHSRVKKIAAGTLKVTDLPDLGVDRYAIGYYKNG